MDISRQINMVRVQENILAQNKQVALQLIGGLLNII